MQINKELFYQEVYQIVAAIPPGRVATYGLIASLAGAPCHSRLAGKALSQVPDGLNLPCHRVVNSQGRTAPGWEQQRELLQNEGVAFKSNGCVDLNRYCWNLNQE